MARMDTLSQSIRLHVTVPPALAKRLPEMLDGITVRSLAQALVALAAEGLESRDGEHSKTG